MSVPVANTDATVHDNNYNSENLSIIVHDARDALDELFADYANLRRGAEVNLTTNGVVLGLLLNALRAEASIGWTLLTKILFFIAVALLVASAGYSLLLQLSHSFKLGRVDPVYLLNHYGRSTPNDLRMAQLSALVSASEKIAVKQRQLGDRVNLCRRLTIWAIMFVGAGMISILVSEYLPLIEGVLHEC